MQRHEVASDRITDEVTGPRGITVEGPTPIWRADGVESGLERWNNGAVSSVRIAGHSIEPLRIC